MRPAANESKPFDETRKRSDARLAVLFTFAAFWGAALLFVLEPLFAKMVLPLFGGAPAVWNTSMLFFQLLLLLAYIYSHHLGKVLNSRYVLIHCAALFAGLAILPIRLRPNLGPDALAAHPIPLLLAIAAGAIGLPFFFAATTAPLLQKWFSHTDHASASQPYFLYAASNAGSLAGLASYPIVLEREFTLSQQSGIWSAAYVAFLALMVACGLAAYRRRRPEMPAVGVLKVVERAAIGDKLLWGMLAFVPASLLYGVTAQLSTDFPPIPLLWVLPLAIYLVSFIVAFSPGFQNVRRSVRMLPTFIVISMFLFQWASGVRAWAPIGMLKLLCFAFIATAFHIEVARRRPATTLLTTFYLWIAIGGIIGGVVNAIVAPVTFAWYWEYPATLLIAAALLPTIAGVERKPLKVGVLWAFVVAVCVAGLVVRKFPLPHPLAASVLLLAISAFICVRAPVKWTAVVLALTSIFVTGTGTGTRTIYQGRSFFGVYRVLADDQKHALFHGTTMHGEQRFDDSFLKTHPQGYYAAVRPVFGHFANNPGARFAVVGLGAGTLACYAGSDQFVGFFEIDPLVAVIANRADLFTYLRECRARKDIVLGDARLTLRNAAPHSFAMVVLDAFSSDTVPAHLLTGQAFDVYRQKLAPNGLLLVHVTNRFLDLAPIVAGSAIFPGYSVLHLVDRPGKADLDQGRLPSHWVLVAPSQDATTFESLGWKRFSGGAKTWTDDYYSVLDAILWRRILGGKP